MSLEEVDFILKRIDKAKLKEDLEREKILLSERLAREVEERRRKDELEVRSALRNELSTIGKALRNFSFKAEFTEQTIMQTDIDLIRQWSNRPNNWRSASYIPNDSLTELFNDLKSPLFERLVSARIAEKIAIKYYEQKSKNVEDVSLSQLTHDDYRWKTHDIEFNNIPIDVKNSRRSFSNCNNYSEHCVKKFKN